MNPDHKKQIIATLKREIGTMDGVKAFSSLLREFNICDLSNEVQLEKAANSGMLLTLLTYHQFGLLPKLKEISEEIKNV